MQSLDTQSVLILFIAGVVVLQAVGIAVFFTITARSCRLHKMSVNRISTNTSQKLLQMERILDGVVEFEKKLPALASALSNQLTFVADRADRVDHELQKGIGAIREGLAVGDRKFEEGLVNFERQTALVQRVVRHPALQVTAVVRAGLAFVSRLLDRHDDGSGRQPAGPAGDDEIFI